MIENNIHSMRSGFAVHHDSDYESKTQFNQTVNPKI